MSEKREDVVKRMADLMRGGAALLAETCPVCGLPLLKLRSGEIVCPVHGRIFVAKTEEEVAEASILGTLTELEKVASSAIAKIISEVRAGQASEERIRELLYWLDAIERVERIKGYLSSREAKPSEKREAKS